MTNSDPKPRMYLVEDHPFALKSLMDLFQSFGFPVVGMAKDIETAEREIRDLRPDVITVDINMGDESALGLIERLAEDDQFKVLVFSTRDNIQTISAAYEAGAKGYLPKNGDILALPKAAEKIFAGQTWFMPGILEKLTEYRHSKSVIDPRAALTDKEFEMFMAVARGETTEDIARDMNIQIGTLHNKLSAIRKKLECKTTSAMTLMAIRYGYLAME